MDLSRTPSLKWCKCSRTHYLRVRKAFGHCTLDIIFKSSRFQETCHGVSKPLRCKHRCKRPQDIDSTCFWIATWPYITATWPPKTSQNGAQEGSQNRLFILIFCSLGSFGAKMTPKAKNEYPKSFEGPSCTDFKRSWDQEDP